MVLGAGETLNFDTHFQALSQNNLDYKPLHYRLVLVQTNVWPIHFTITAGIVVGVCTFIFIGFSRMSPPPSHEVIEKYTFKKELIHQENKGLAWYQNYQYWALLLFLCIVTLFFILF